MSTVENVEQTRNKLVTNYDTTKFLLGFNEFISGDVTASGADVDLLQGMVMGQIDSTLKYIPMDKDATDGSQIPAGLCVVTQAVADGTTEDVKMVNKGRIAESIVNFLDVETLDTLIGPASNQRTVRAYLNDLGIVLMGGTELTALDNQ